MSDGSKQREELLMDQIDLKNRIIERLVKQIERLVKQLDDAKDAAESLMVELDAAKVRLAAANATVDRLRLHIQQGIEL